MDTRIHETIDGIFYGLREISLQLQPPKHEPWHSYDEKNRQNRKDIEWYQQVQDQFYNAAIAVSFIYLREHLHLEGNAANAVNSFAEKYAQQSGCLKEELCNILRVEKK